MKEKFLPESYATKRDTFIFPSGCNSVGVIGDLHIPYQDNDAIEAAFDEMEKQNIESLLINGDMLDFYQLSFHEKDPRMVHFKQEIEKEQIMNAFEAAEKDCGRDFLHGDLYYNETFKPE